MERERTIKKIRELGLIAVVRGESREAALEVSGALIEGGVLGIEVTFTTPEAHLAIKDLDEEYGDRILVGAGTVTTPDQASKAAANGAKFLVSPGCDPTILPIMQETELAVLPGVLTPSEVMVAQGLGIDTVKLFPGSLGGPSHLKNLRGPFPHVSFLPTGGVSVENVEEWFAASAFAVGAGSSLAPAALGASMKRSDVIARASRFQGAVPN